MLAHRRTLCCDLADECDSEGTAVTWVYMHVSTTSDGVSLSADSNNIDENNYVISTADTWAVRMGKFKGTDEGWSVCLSACASVCVCTVCVWGCLVPFLMNCINPYTDWENLVLFPISSWLSAVYLWVWRHRPTGASESHTHKHARTQSTSFRYTKNILQRLSKESYIFL